MLPKSSKNFVCFKGKGIPQDQKLSLLIPKGDPFECGPYRAIKLLEHCIEDYGKGVENRIQKQVTIDEMQFGFTPSRGTTDAIFIPRQIQEKFRAKKKTSYHAFADLEKAYDRVLR